MPPSRSLRAPRWHGDRLGFAPLSGLPRSAKLEAAAFGGDADPVHRGSLLSFVRRPTMIELIEVSAQIRTAGQGLAAPSGRRVSVGRKGAFFHGDRDQIRLQLQNFRIIGPGE